VADEAQGDRVTADLTLSEMTELVELLTRASASDGAGGSVLTWAVSSPPVFLYAKLHESTSGETYASDQLGNDDQRTFDVWFNSGITVRHGLRWQGRDYELTSVEDVKNRHRVMRLRARSRSGL